MSSHPTLPGARTALAAFIVIATSLGGARAQEAAPAGTSEPVPAEAPLPAPGTDEERLQRAKGERAEEQAAENAGAKAEAESKDAEAERARLEAMGATPADQPMEEDGGFFVDLEVSSTTVGGADRGIAKVGEIVTAAANADELDTDPPGQGLADAFTMANQRVLSLEYGSKVAPRLEIGFRRKSGGAFSLRYFGWSADASLAADASWAFASPDPTQGSLIVGGIDNQGVESTAATYSADPGAYARPFGSPAQITRNGLTGADSVVASGKVEIQRWDLLYSRTALARKRFELTYRIGLELVDAKRSEAATFTWRSFVRSRVFRNALSVEDVRASCQTTGIGPIVGVAGRYGITANRRWSVRLGVEVAGLKADRKTHFSDAQQLTQDGLSPTPPLEVFQDVDDPDAGSFLTIVDADAAVEYRFGERFRVGLGYRQGWWMSALGEEHFPSAGNPALLESRDVDLDVGGPYVRVGAYF